MRALLLETSTERGVVAIMQDDELLYHSELPFGYQNSKYLLPHLEAGLKKLALSVRDMDYIAVGIGPGSYTGMRVGAATAKALTFALQLPLVGICTLKTFVPQEAGSFAVIIDAKISGVYLITGKKDEQRVIYTSSPEVVALDKLEHRLQRIELWITPNTTRLRPLLAERYPQLQVNWQEQAPDPKHMNKLALQCYEKGEYSRQGDLNLMYLNKTQAEIEKNRIK